MKTYFISDTHLGHEKILQFERQFRRFGSIEEHDATIIDKWNAVVKEEDLVYHLGDVAWNKRALALIGACKGKKILIMGNHDKFDTTEYLKYFTNVYGICTINKVVLSHTPIHPMEMERWDLNIHGHRHGQPQLPGKYWCVSCEHTNLEPISLEEILILKNES